MGNNFFPGLQILPICLAVTADGGGVAEAQGQRQPHRLPGLLLFKNIFNPVKFPLGVLSRHNWYWFKSNC